MIEIVCIKIPETSSELFELGRKYKAHHIPGLGFDNRFKDIATIRKEKLRRMAFHQR